MCIQQQNIIQKNKIKIRFNIWGGAPYVLNRVSDDQFSVFELDSDIWDQRHHSTLSFYFRFWVGLRYLRPATSLHPLFLFPFFSLIQFLWTQRLHSTMYICVMILLCSLSAFFLSVNSLFSFLINHIPFVHTPFSFFINHVPWKGLNPLSLFHCTFFHYFVWPLYITNSASSLCLLTWEFLSSSVRCTYSPFYSSEIPYLEYMSWVSFWVCTSPFCVYSSLTSF